MQVKEAIHRYEYCVGAPFPFSPTDFSVGEEAKRDHEPTLQICTSFLFHFSSFFGSYLQIVYI